MAERVLVISPVFRPNIGGVETHLDDLCEYLRKRGHRVYVITYQPITTDARGEGVERREKLEVHRIPWPGHNLFHRLEPYPPLEFLYLSPGLFLYGLYFLLRRRRDIDVIHAHGLVPAFVGLLLAKAFRKRSVFSSHTVYSMKKGSLISKAVKGILNSYDKVLCLSESSREEMRYLGVEDKKIGVYMYWVDQEVFRPLDKVGCRDGLGWKKRLVVLFVGRLIKVKGVETLLEAAKKLEGREILFAFIGDGPLTQKVASAAKETRNIAFYGKVDNKELARYYSAADVTILPSGWEGIPRVLIESLSCGTPVIASKAGGISEIVRGDVGLLIEPDVEGIIGALSYLLDRPERAAEMGRGCRGHAERLFGERNGELIRESYRPP